MTMSFYWDVAHVIYRYLMILGRAYMAVRFVRPYLKNRERVWRVGAAYAASLIFMNVIPYEMQGVWAYTVGGVVMCAAMYAIDRRNLRQKVFLAVFALLFSHIARELAWFPFSLLYQYGIILLPDDAPLPLLISQFILADLGILILYVVIMYVMTELVNRVYYSKQEDMSASEFVLMLFPLVLALSGYYIFPYIELVYEKDTGEMIQDVHAQYDWFLALYWVFTYGTIFVTVLAFQKIKKSQREEQENAVLAEQISNIENHIRQVEKMYGDIRSLRHDMGNHIMTLEGLYRNHAQGEAEQYAESLRESYEELSFHMKSGNPVTDIILDEMRKRAEELGIAFESEFRFPADCSVNAFDVSVILNNALVNAIEGAAGEEPYIYIHSGRRNNVYLLEVKNSFQGRLVIDEETGLPRTNKGSGHGFGLANIRRVAKKYHGDVSVQSDGESFILTVMLMMR